MKYSDLLKKLQKLSKEEFQFLNLIFLDRNHDVIYHTLYKIGENLENEIYNNKE